MIKLDLSLQEAYPAMNKCKDDCENLIRCSKCDKQLCKLGSFKNDTAIGMKHCTNEGFYLVGDERVCAVCHTLHKKNFPYSPFSEKRR